MAQADVADTSKRNGHVKLGDEQADGPPHSSLVGRVWRELTDQAQRRIPRADLDERVKLLFDEELLRFMAVLDRAGPLDPVAAVRLYQAEYSLEAAR